MAKLVSKTYGEALYEIAMQDEAGKGKVLFDEVVGISDILKENPQFDKLMEHPGIPKQEKLEILQQVFKSRVCDELLGFLEVIVSKERYKELPEIIEYFIAKMKEHAKIGVAFITTAVEIDAKKRAEIEARILATTKYETLEPHYEVDASLLGGMVIRIGDRVVDSSISTKLGELKKQLLQIQLG